MRITYGQRMPFFGGGCVKFQLSQFEAIFGPPAPYTEHQIGDQLSYIVRDAPAEQSVTSGILAYTCTGFSDVSASQVSYIIFPLSGGQTALFDIITPAHIIERL